MGLVALWVVDFVLIAAAVAGGVWLGLVSLPPAARTPDGRAFVKLEGIRRAYDVVLADCCDHLGVDHLIGVLEPGAELDAERARVERRLMLSGVDLPVTG
ncbi:MAG: hypothetical protein ACRDPH_08395 [Marmoricola sp.]